MPYQIIIALALPAFLLLVGVEYYFSRMAGKKYYLFSSSVSNISIGTAERLIQLFVAGYFVVVLQYVQTHFAVFHMEANVFTWLALFVLTDFLWYWYHRLSHTVNLLWGAHIVHHQSEEYNLTVSFRITIFQALIRFCFYLPLPILGFTPEMVLVTFSICGIYQFFIHTQAIKKLGVLEEVLVTPSHHRVHHGSNPIYLDKNFGGVFIIWDRLFGTFRRETEAVRYGLTKQVESNSFLWLHFHFWLTMWENFKRGKGAAAKFRALFGGPDALSYDHDIRIRKLYLFASDPHGHIGKKSSPQLYGYIYVQMTAVLGALFFVYLFPPGMPVLLFSTAVILLTLVNCGAILEQKRWIFPLEVGRFIATYILLALLTDMLLLLAYLPVFILAILWNYSVMKKRYLRLLYTNP